MNVWTWIMEVYFPVLLAVGLTGLVGMLYYGIYKFFTEGPSEDPT